MKSSARTTVVLLAAMLLTWHGLLLSTPHHHADPAIPQEELACSASHPSSQTSHLHDTGQLLSLHPCLECLAGSIVADAAATAAIEEAADLGIADVVTASDHRSRYHSHLPLHRGPPSLV